MHKKLQGEFISTRTGPVDIHHLHYNKNHKSVSGA